MEKEYNKYLWSPKQPRVYGISPLTISGTPMPEEDVATLLKVENSQQRFQQNPIVKRSEQWEVQQKQREEEIAASKKWLELHPEDESDSPYTILERGKHQAIVDGKDPSYYEKMIDDGKQFTKGALSVLSLPYLGAATAGAYGYGVSLGARGLFAAQGIHGLANENGIRKTANLIKSGDYGRAALSGAGDVLNAAMILPGAKLLGNAAKYGLKATYVADRLANNVRNVTLPYNIYGNDSRRPLSQFIDANRNEDSNSYWLKTNKYDKHTGKPLDIRNLDGAKFGDGGYGNDGGKVDGIFMSYGEPWQEFAVTSRDAWYKFPNRSSERSATNWKGDKMDYSVKDAYDAELAYRKVGDFMGSIPENTDPYEMGKMWLFEKSKYPILKKIPQAGDRYFANQTVIPKHELTYDSFLKQPFWKYTEDSISGQVQQELFMQWPKNNTQGRTYLGLLERPSKLSEAELEGVPKSVRNQPIRESTFDTRASNDIIETYSNGSWRTTRPFTEEQILAEKNPEVQANMKYSLEKWKKDNANMYENYIDDTSKFNTDLQEYINSLNIEPSSKYLDGELIDGVRETNPFVKLYRQYLYNNGTDASSISNTDLAKLLTAQEQEIRSGMTGIMADKSPLWHGSNSLFDTFDWQKYASINTENAGAIGPGNYFSTQGVPYGFDRNLKRVRNMQPYFITDIRSTPSGRMMQNKGLLPEYRRKYELVHNPEWLQQEVKRIVPGQNTTLYIDYNEPMSGIMDVTRGAGMLRRNTGIKSLFPHPSRLVRGENGLLKMLPTNWDDPRVNFKQGGILKRK